MYLALFRYRLRCLSRFFFFTYFYVSQQMFVYDTFTIVFCPFIFIFTSDTYMHLNSYFTACCWVVHWGHSGMCTSVWKDEEGLLLCMYVEFGTSSQQAYTREGLWFVTPFLAHVFPPIFHVFWSLKTCVFSDFYGLFSQSSESLAFFPLSPLTIHIPIT